MRIYKLSALALLALGVAACDQESLTEKQAPEFGAMDLALSIEGGLEIDTVELSIIGEGVRADITRNRSLNVDDTHATISAKEGGLPPGSYQVSLSASVLDLPSTYFDESTIACAGSVSGVEVAAGTTADAQFTMVCTKDGAQVQLAGALRINANSELVELNQCPDLYSSAFIAPLTASVGSSVQLGIELMAGASVVWSASRGIVAADGSNYTCPDVPGDYTVFAEISTEDGCRQSFSEVVSCRSAYVGECATLPQAFSWEGNCGLRSPCHLISQDGCSWTATCRDQVISGEGTSEVSFPFAYSRGSTELDCAAELVNGELVGTCEGARGTCQINTNRTPSPAAACEHVLDLPSVTVCGETQTMCDVIQDACTFQAKCSDGTLRTGDVVGDELRWNMDESPNGGNYYRCQEPIVDGVSSGACRRLRGELEPEVCEDFHAEVNLLDLGTCTETLPTQGFKLEGCGLDGVAFATQRDCVWQVVSQVGTFGGFAPANNTYSFESPTGESCVASVVAGRVVGSCGAGSSACSFDTVEPAVDQNCFQIPNVVTTRGCGFGAPTPFQVVQDGCDFYGYASSRGVFVAGEATEIGIRFPGISEGWVCQADLNEEAGELWGGCSRANEDGTTSLCRDFTNSQGDRLVIGL